MLTKKRSSKIIPQSTSISGTFAQTRNMVKGLSVFGYLMPRKRVTGVRRVLASGLLNLNTTKLIAQMSCQNWPKRSSELSLLWCECHSLKSRFKGTQSILDHRHEMQQNIKHVGEVLWFLNLYLRGFGDTSLIFHHHLGWPTGGLHDKQFAISSMQSITNQPLVGDLNPFEQILLVKLDHFPRDQGEN